MINWTAISAVATSISAVVALAITIINLNGMKYQRENSQLLGIIKIHESIDSAQRKIHDAATLEIQNYYAIELINLIELLATLSNAKVITSAMKDHTDNYLKECIAKIKINDGWREIMRSSVSGKSTYRNIVEFENKHLGEINILSKEYQKDLNK